jgi:hypothetical protein
MDLFVEFGTVLAPIPVTRLPIMHLQDDFMGKVALNVRSINAHKLALVCKISLRSLCKTLPFLGIKLISPGELTKATQARSSTMVSFHQKTSLW